MLVIVPLDTEMRNVWNEGLNKVELGVGWRHVERKLPTDTLCPSGTMLPVGAKVVFTA